jgi:hypothetical protein
MAGGRPSKEARQSRKSAGFAVPLWPATARTDAEAGRLIEETRVLALDDLFM